MRNPARPSIHGLALPPMRPTTTTSSPSLAAPRTSLTGLAPAGSAASRYLAPSAAGASAAGGAGCEHPAASAAARKADHATDFFMGTSRSVGVWSNRFQPFRDEQAHRPDRRRDRPGDPEQQPGPAAD